MEGFTMAGASLWVVDIFYSLKFNGQYPKKITNYYPENPVKEVFY